jgi:hypothetical protein
MSERSTFRSAEEERLVASELLLPYRDSSVFNSWSVIKALSTQYPDLRGQILGVNPVWLLAHETTDHASTQPTNKPAGAVRIPFSMTRTYIPTDSIDIRNGARLPERRHYIGIDASTQFVTESFSISIADTPPLAMQPQHFHAKKDEIIIPLDPIWLTAKNEPDVRGQSSLVNPGKYAWIGANTYHTLVNPTAAYSPHLCLRYPEPGLQMDWESEPPEAGAFEFSFGSLDDKGITFSKGGNSARVRVATRKDMLDPTDFGTLLFAQIDNTALVSSADRGDFGSFIFVPPSNKSTSMPSELLEGYQDTLILFQRLS